MAAEPQPGVNLERLLVLLKRKGIPLPFEIGAFVALQSAEALGDRNLLVRVNDVWLADDGALAVVAEQRAASEQAATQSLVTLLSDLLVAAAPGVPAMLLALIERGPSDGSWTLRALRDDLEACLVPLNRGATRRVVARLLREAGREGERPGLVSASKAPPQAAMDDELDALLGTERPRQPINIAAQLVASPGRFESVRPPRGRADEHTQPVFDEELQLSPGPVPSRASIGLADELEPPDDHEHLHHQHEDDEDDDDPRDHLPTTLAPPRPRLDAPIDLPDTSSAAEGRGSLWVGIALVLLTAALGVGYFVVGPERLRELVGASRSKGPAASTDAPLAAPAVSYGSLVVTSTPDRAQVFLLAGRGPALINGLPVGVAQELLAVADGREPTRALVPADAAWEDAGEGPRYELAMQTGEAVVTPERWDFGPSKLPESMGVPSGEVGQLRVVTSPPGARVYQLIGFTPSARVDNLKLDELIEVLVYAPGHIVQRMEVPPSMFTDVGGKRIAQVDITLRPTAAKKTR